MRVFESLVQKQDPENVDQFLYGYNRETKNLEIFKLIRGEDVEQDLESAASSSDSQKMANAPLLSLESFAIKKAQNQEKQTNASDSTAAGEYTPSQLLQSTTTSMMHFIEED